MRYCTLIIIIFVEIEHSYAQANLDFKYHSKSVNRLEQIDYDVYSSVLSKYYSDSSFIIVRQKVSFKTLESSYRYNILKPKFPEIDSSAFFNFIKLRDSLVFLDNCFEIPNSRTILISEEELYNIYYLENFKINWMTFYCKYPKSIGLIELSRIGFNENKDKATVEISHHYNTGGKVFIYFLSKTETKWSIIIRAKTSMY